MSQTVFRRLCKERQWGRPEVFLKVYAKVAAGLGEPDACAAPSKARPSAQASEL